MSRAALHRWEAITLEKITEMIARKTVIAGRQAIVQSYLKRGALIPRHVHPDEQTIYVLQGALRIVVGDEEFTVRENELLFVPADAPHEADALDDTFVLSLTLSTMR